MLVLGTNHIRPAALRLQRRGGTSETLRGEDSSQKTVLRGPDRMKRFRVRAEHLVEAGDLCCGETLWHVRFGGRRD